VTSSSCSCATPIATRRRRSPSACAPSWPSLSRSAVSTTVSIGLVAWQPGATVETLLRDADVALYCAKDAGGNGAAWFDAESHQRLLDHIALESDLREALAGGQFELHYQPSFTIEGDSLVGVEALSRWIHPEKGPIAPEVFIPLAEECGLIGQLDRLVLETSCRQAAQWCDLPGFRVWVNVSGVELTPGYADSVLDLLEAEGVPAHRIGIEVTESVLADETVAVHQLRCLHDAGVAVAIDDFGTGYSSLARLAMLPISLLKIDRAFVSNAATPFGRAAIDLIVHLADALGVPTVAEGVEDPDQLEVLREVGVVSASGYLLGRPAPAQSHGPQIVAG
jgi:EAL domain-containing protein (putative c-di-GMP-specific phosphodiesterase class I)